MYFVCFVFFLLFSLALFYVIRSLFSLLHATIYFTEFHRLAFCFEKSLISTAFLICIFYDASNISEMNRFIAVPAWSPMTSLWAISESLTSFAMRWSTPGSATMNARTCSTLNCPPWSTTPCNWRASSRCEDFTLVSNSRVRFCCLFSFVNHFWPITLADILLLPKFLIDYKPSDWMILCRLIWECRLKAPANYMRGLINCRETIERDRVLNRHTHTHTKSCAITAEPVHYVKEPNPFVD